MNNVPDALEVLSARVDALEKRVHALEHHAETVEPAPLQLPETPLPQAIEESVVEQSSGLFATLGRAMLGIAGAYVLRAFMESAVLPRQIVAALAIVYALLWLAGASRAVPSKPIAGAIYAGTSALILAPMLWELTLRFNLLTPLLAAAVLAAFLATATALAWKPERSLVASVAYGAASVVALVLAVTTHQVLPFLAILLLAAALCEFGSTFRHGLAVRSLVVIAADLAVFLTVYIYGSTETNRADYPALSAGLLLAPAVVLFLISAAGIVARVGVFRKQIELFDAAQAVIAFLLVIFSGFLFEPGMARSALGATCLLLSALCYAAVLGRFRAVAEQRNLRVFSLWSAALLLAGALWSMPPAWAAALLGVAALVAVTVGVRQQFHVLEFHGVVFLVTAAVVSGLTSYASAVLAGAPPARPAWRVVLVAACAVLAYAAGRERQGESWKQQALHLVPALLAAGSVAALLVQGFLGLTAQFVVPVVFHVALARTVTLCAVALVFAYGGAHWRRLEMTRVAYAALALMALKLMVEDLRHGRMEFIAASIFLFAVTLIAVPRLTRMQHRPVHKA
jgi:hypothetical protein